eukprot:11084293-Alexandrium_andersonii.AAC.1
MLSLEKSVSSSSSGAQTRLHAPGGALGACLCMALRQGMATSGSIGVAFVVDQGGGAECWDRVDVAHLHKATSGSIC